MEKNMYTKLALRETIKKRLVANNNGKWNARLAQQVAMAYKKAGGGYKAASSEKQNSLKKWTKEKWGYSSKAIADKVKKTGVIARYLPKKAWSSLSNIEKKATNDKKIEGTKKGIQFVANTNAAKLARKKVSK